jgi:hypothetical protein
VLVSVCVHARESADDHRHRSRISGQMHGHSLNAEDVGRTEYKQRLLRLPLIKSRKTKKVLAEREAVRVLL